MKVLKRDGECCTIVSELNCSGSWDVEIRRLAGELYTENNTTASFLLALVPPVAGSFDLGMQSDADRGVDRGVKEPMDVRLCGF